MREAMYSWGKKRHHKRMWVHVEGSDQLFCKSGNVNADGKEWMGWGRVEKRSQKTQKCNGKERNSCHLLNVEASELTAFSYFSGIRKPRVVLRSRCRLYTSINSQNAHEDHAGWIPSYPHSKQVRTLGVAKLRD